MCSIEDNHRHFDVAPPVSDSPPGFAVAAWSLLVDCMCDEGRQFYLSANELLLVCELSQQNVAVFATHEERAQLHGSVTGHAASTNISVALHVGGADGRVRSHFQRLVPLGELRRAAEQAEEERAQRR